MAKPYIKDGKISAWQTDIIALAKNSNVFCKLSGMLTEADWKNWKNEDFKPYFDTIFKAFGTERILYGSDWPVSLLAGDYKQVLQVVKNYMRQFSKEKKALVMGINACNFYNLEQ
jgi:L-fuconolactonase